MATMKDATQKYQHIFSLSKELATLGSVHALLHWDQETHMPPAGAAARATQLELITGIMHKKRTSPAFRKALEELIDLDTGAIKVSGLDRASQAALREWRRDFLIATRLPSRFVKQFASLTSLAIEAWKEARAGNAFQRFAPYLERIVAFWQERAELLGYDDHPYDALLDHYEPGAKTAQIATLFGKLKPELIKLLKELRERKPAKTEFLHARYEKEKQMECARFVLDCVGFTKERGALDLATHPFCTNIHTGDNRITTRVDERDFLENILVLLHEGGHYLYEANLPAETWGSPLSEAASMAVHESQSRWWETLVGLSRPFWEYALPELQKAFPKQLGKVGLEPFVKGINALKGTPIRVRSDEVSYCLHIILRFELECALITGELEVRQLPAAWNELMVELLDILPKDDAEGCLQDIHWSCGYCGYFPTYALGNLYAAQFFSAFEEEHANWGTRLAKGDFLFMREWLNEKIHRHGRRYQPAELIRKVTGKALSAEPYVKYLKQKLL